MSQAAFDALRATFDALPQVKAPPTPVAVALSEADALLAFLRDDGSASTPDAPKPGAATVAKLVAVGLPADHIDRFAQATDALRFAQSRRSNARHVRAADPQTLSDARALRDDVLAACRWNLRHDRVALGALRALPLHNTASSLDSALSALAQLLTQRAAAFSSDASFHPLQRAAACDHAAALVRASYTTTSHLKHTKKDATNDRDRAWTHFKALLRTLRDAAQYALRDDPQTLTRFASAHKQQLNRTARANAKPKAPKAPKAPKTPKASKRKTPTAAPPQTPPSPPDSPARL